MMSEKFHWLQITIYFILTKPALLHLFVSCYYMKP